MTKNFAKWNITDHRSNKVRELQEGINIQIVRYTLTHLDISWSNCPSVESGVVSWIHPFLEDFHTVLISSHWCSLSRSHYSGIFLTIIYQNKSLEIAVQFPLANIRSSNYPHFFFWGGGTKSLWLEILFLLILY